MDHGQAETEHHGWRSRTALVTGAASGIGLAIAEALARRGAHVLRADLEQGDIRADLGTTEGRTAFAEQARALAPDGLDIVVAAAGVAMAAPDQIVAVNYFGAVASLEATRPLLALRPGARAIGIVSSAVIMGLQEGIMTFCLAGDEAGAKRTAQAAADGVYADSKLAFGRWLRLAAVSPEWAGAGIALNGIAPGTVRTPMTAPLLASEEGRKKLAQSTPIAVADYAGPDAIAEVAVAIAGLESGYMLGQIVFLDGGADAILRNGQV